ncbi:MAG: D-aminoacyl-tRNA deacylase [Thermoproteota archaeon]|nr:D-aminoacyl-tRNA deacylase [Thermoproteota archaeon]
MVFTLILATKDDVASSNIAARLLEEYPFVESSLKFRSKPVYSLTSVDGEVLMAFMAGEMVYLEGLEGLADARLVVFVSRHESRSGSPILSVHVPGNLSTAEFGGVSERVSIAPANAMQAALRMMAEQRKLLGLKGFEVYYEGTHHGPSLDVPSMFVEIGSSIKEWSDPLAGKAIAHAAMAAAMNKQMVDAAVGIGGSHCNRRLTNLGLEFNLAFGHIIPSYAFKWLNPDTIKQCVERTLEKNPTVVLDWKGIDGKDRDGLQAVLDKVPYKIKHAAEYRDQ